jgi:hypothetical protein
MTPLERAKADLLRLQKDLNRAEMTVKMLEGQISRVEAYIEMAPVYESDESQGEASRARSNGVAATSVRLAIEAIRERGQRIHTRELIQILQNQGITIGGSNPVANLSGFLSRADDLDNSRSEGWGLASWRGDKVSQEIRASNDAAISRMEHQIENGGQVSRKPTEADEEEESGDLDDEIPF